MYHLYPILINLVYFGVLYSPSNNKLDIGVCSANSFNESQQFICSGISFQLLVCNKHNFPTGILMKNQFSKLSMCSQLVFIIVSGESVSSQVVPFDL